MTLRCCVEDKKAASTCPSCSIKRVVTNASPLPSLGAQFPSKLPPRGYLNKLYVASLVQLELLVWQLGIPGVQTA